MTITETPTATAVLTGVTAATVGRTLAHVGKVASTDLARGVLAGIHVSTTVDPDSENTMLTFTATDSYRLITVSIPLTADDIVPSFDPFVIYAKDTGKVAKLITRKNVNAGVGFTVTGPTFTLTTTDGSGNVDLLTGNYPDFDKLLTPENTGELPRLNASLMAGLLDAMAGVITTGKDAIPSVWIDSVGGTSKAMRWSATVPDVARVVGVIMPIRP